MNIHVATFFPHSGEEELRAQINKLMDLGNAKYADKEGPIGEGFEESEDGSVFYMRDLPVVGLKLTHDDIDFIRWFRPVGESDAVVFDTEIDYDNYSDWVNFVVHMTSSLGIESSEYRKDVDSKFQDLLNQCKNPISFGKTLGHYLFLKGVSGTFNSVQTETYRWDVTELDIPKRVLADVLAKLTKSEQYKPGIYKVKPKFLFMIDSLNHLMEVTKNFSIKTAQASNRVKEEPLIEYAMLETAVFEIIGSLFERARAFSAGQISLELPDMDFLKKTLEPIDTKDVIGVHHIDNIDMDCDCALMLSQEEFSGVVGKSNQKVS